MDVCNAANALIETMTSLSDAQRDELRAEMRAIDSSSDAELCAELGNSMKSLACGVAYPFEQLSHATDSFSADTLLGAGSQGSVHRGRLESGSIVAIKRLIKVDQQTTDEVINEAKILALILHDNIVPLIGSSFDGPEHCLVYQLMEYGSLSDLLFGDNYI